jgi:hypothetical protein
MRSAVDFDIKMLICLIVSGTKLTDICIIYIFFTSLLPFSKKPSNLLIGNPAISVQKYISLMRPVAFRHPISRILAFSWTYEYTYPLSIYAKIIQIQTVMAQSLIWQALTLSVKYTENG